MNMPAVTPRTITILILIMSLPVYLAAPLAGQSAGRMWAAQTGPDQVTLAWDSIPGAMEYRIYLGVPGVSGAPIDRPPAVRLSAGGRQALLTGIERLSNGIYLVAMDANGRVLQQARFNQVGAATTSPPIAPPAEVVAEATGATEVTLSWSPVPGATAYLIGRAVGGSGLSMICNLCSTEGRYVDRSAAPGLPHSYTVSAIFPSGISRRVTSNQVKPGVTDVAATPGPQQTLPTGTTQTTFAHTATPVTATAQTTTSPTATNPIGGMLSGIAGALGSQVNPVSTTTHTATPATATAQTTTSPTATNPIGGMLSGIAGALGSQMMNPVSTTTHTATPVTATAQTATSSTATNPIGGMLSGVAGALGSQVNPVSTTTHTATPVTATAQTTTSPTASNPIGEMLSGIAGALGSQPNPVSPPTAVTASVTGPGTVLVTWQASPMTGVTQYRINRRVNGGAWESLNTVGPSTLTYSDTFFPVTLFASGPAHVSYNVVALKSTARSPAAATADLVVQPIVPTAGLPSRGTLAAVCRLDYQRADNMWAAFGRPDGPLGTETISLSPGQDKVFITDWKYEKTRNDGSNYYGSHLRIATNSGSSPIRLQLRTLTMTGLLVFARTGSDTFWIRMDPGKTLQFQADLMEVFCEK